MFRVRFSMRKVVTEKNFFKILDKISNKRSAAMNEVTSLFEDMWAKRDTRDLSHYIWSSLALELYLSRRKEEAIQAQLYAIELAEKDGDVRQELTALYGDLGMFYEANAQYEEASDAMKISYEYRKEFRGEDHILTRRAKEDAERLEHFKSFKKDPKLKKEFHDWVRKAGKDTHEANL